MRTLSLFFWVTLAVWPPVFAQTELFDLDGEMGAVVRSHETELTLERGGTLRSKVRTEVDVLGPAGQERYGTLSLVYDVFRSVKKMSGRIVGPDGKTIRKLRRGEIEDHPAVSSYSLYEDNRVRVAQLFHNTYPYTVVWEYEMEYEGLLNWPTWWPQRGEEPVLHASLTVDVPEDESLRFLPVRLPFLPTETVEKGRRIYHWQGMLPPIEYEPLAQRGQAPRLYLTADRFSMAGHAGSLASWTGLGEWYSRLSQGRAELPEAARAEVLALVEGVDDPRERARLVYHHLQTTVRYVSVQLGIGGWQPFPAEYVYERRYGDCKALTNYLEALLRAVGIEAYPALIGSGLSDLDPAFPRNAFNHVILYVPLPDGDLWLEATSQTIPFGMLGPGTEDRWALVVEPGSGRLVRTPASAADDNLQIRRTEIELTPTGRALIQAETRYAGQPLRSIRGALADRSEQEQHEWWSERLSLDALDLNVVYRDGRNDTAGMGWVGLRAALPRYGTAAGSRLIFNPNVLERWASVPPAVEERTLDVEFGYPFADYDTVRVALPAGYAVEAMPEPVEVDTPFGRYEARAEVEDGALTYTRAVRLTERRVPPEQYDAYRDFVLAVVRADEAQVVLRRE